MLLPDRHGCLLKLMRSMILLNHKILGGLKFFKEAVSTSATKNLERPSKTFDAKKLEALLYKNYTTTLQKLEESVNITWETISIRLKNAKHPIGGKMGFTSTSWKTETKS